MKTIEERAESANPNNPHGDNYEVGQYFGFMDGYETGATEQRQIDIDKAWEFICTHYVVGMDYEDFVKTMEE